MKKGLLKAATLVAVFFLSLAIFGSFMQQNQIDLTTEMGQAVLPVITLYYKDTQMNELHGYTSPMNATGMRDTITPVMGNQEIPLRIKTYGYQIDEVSYEIRSIDGKRLISDGSIPFFQEEKEQVKSSIPVQSLLEPAKEYILTLKLKQEEDTCYFYTRIADAQDCYIQESVQFAKKVNELTFSDVPDALSTYWEPNVTGDNSTLHKVTINSSLTQANWADFDCSRLTPPVPSVKEMNSSYNAIVLYYVVTTNGENGELEYYNVEEHYRIRYTSERMYLLNFERIMNQVFSGENDFLYENYLQLGIRSKEVEYMQNEAGTVTCFVQEGDLWSYNLNTNRLAEVFSFRGREGTDVRENYLQHNIRILKVGEAGDTDYVVYGYMNRGVHEGKVGISFMHYDNLTNMNEEKLFIAFDKSYEVLKAELGKLLYENSEGSIFLLFNRTAYCADVSTLDMKEIAGDLNDDAYAVSESNRYFAWIADNGSRKINIMDLETGQVRRIQVKKGKRLRVLGFLEEDLVYGIASDGDKVNKAAGVEQHPMYALRIVSASNTELLKKYRKGGYYISDVEFHDGVLIIHRLTAGANGYSAAPQDSIVNRNQDTSEQEVVHTTVTDVRQTQVQLVLPDTEKESKPLVVAAKMVVNQEENEVALKPEQEKEGYYAYAWGNVAQATTDIAQAIQSADENMGVVVDNHQNYIWKRARKSLQPPLDVRPSDADASGTDIEKCVSAMLKHEGVEVNVGSLLAQGQTIQEIVESLLAGRKVIGLSGCTLSQILYYVNFATPVMAVTGNKQAVLVIGYDALNIWLYDPQSAGTVKKTIEDAQAQFAAAGGIYMAYQ